MTTLASNPLAPFSEDPNRACAQPWVDPELFFPDAGNSATAAKAICSACPVREPCLAYAMSITDLHGVWGGLSAKERRERRRTA